MKFEKILLISLVVISSFSENSSLQAAQKLKPVEAIWNAVSVADTTNNKITHPVTAQQRKQNQQLIAAAKAKMKLQSAADTSQASQKNSGDSKLARQRALWKAKWDAEQLQKLAAAKPIGQPESNSIQSNALQIEAASRLLVKQTPKPLTREQYNKRWQQQQAKAKTPIFTNADANKYANKQIQKQPRQAAYRGSEEQAAINSLPFEVQHKLRAAKLKSHAMSVYVQDVNSNKPLLGYKDTTSRVPASVMKLITSYAALGTLGPNYRWPLDVYTRGAIKNGSLTGDLIIKGYGSPEFNQADLKKVLQGIRQKGIRNVSGRVVFDNSYFNVPNQGSLDGKSLSAYNANPDALLYNERLNSFQIRATGKKVHVSSLTPTHNLKIVNRMRTTRRGCRPHINVSNKGEQRVVTFSGRYSRRCGTRTYNRVISRPAEMIYGAMQAMWKREVGGKLNTQFATGVAPVGAQPLLRTHSRTLAEILPTIDKDSNNVMARQVMLTIGARASGQGTQQSGANAIGVWLASRGLNFPELRIENGSGLSRHARISARHMGDLLVDAYRSPYRNILMQSLAIAGVDGTMKRRLKGSQVRGKGFFKTGTLRDVRSIAGYVKAADGKTYVMAILHNDPRAPRRALPAHDKLIEWVYSGGRQEQIASNELKRYN